MGSIPRNAYRCGHRRGRLSRLTPLRCPDCQRLPRHLRGQPRHGVPARTSSTSGGTSSSSSTTMSPSISRWTGRSTSSTTSRRRRARSTTCGCRCIRSRPARTGRTTRSGWPSTSGRGSCSPRRARCTGSGGPPPAGDLLGQRQPDRPARRLRRGEALRRGDDDGLSRAAGSRHRDRPDLQHLRPADARPTTAAPFRRLSGRRWRASL